jgi:integrase
MAKKRANKTGSIFQIPNGSWRVLISVQGKRISHNAATQREAAAWARKMTDQVGQGLTFDATRKNLQTFMMEWLAVKETKLRLSTMESYNRLARLYIYPYLGPVLLKDLTAARIQDLYSTLQAKNIGKRTIEIVHTILYGCLQSARKLGLVSQNWAELVEAPRPETREMKVWSEDQVSSFLAAYPDQLLYRLAFATGMRRGELIGLKWQDLDWRSGILKVKRQVYKPAGGGFRFQPPKTDRGRRSIRLGPGLIEALRMQFNQVVPLARAIAGDSWEEYDLIFPTSVGTPRNGYEVTKQFKHLAREAGLPEIRFHDIRHSAASIMLLHGEPPVRVAAILGQSIAVLMDTYAHYIPDDQEQVSALMDEITTPIAIDQLHTNCTTVAPRLEPVQQKLNEND